MAGKFNTEYGFAAIIAMIIVFLIGVLGICIMSTAIVEKKSGANELDYITSGCIAEAGIEYAKKIIYDMDMMYLDVTEDGVLNSQDGIYLSDLIPFFEGAYQFSIQGNYGNEVTMRFRISGGPWNWVQFILKEDGQTISSPMLERFPGQPQIVEVRNSIDLYSHTYDVEVVIYRTNPGAIDVWMDLDGDDSWGDEKLFTFSSGSKGQASQETNIDDRLNLIAGSDEPYLGDVYYIKSRGYVGDNIRGIEAAVKRETFLNFSRFSETSVSYGANAVISGEFYAGTKLYLNGNPVTFKRRVRVVEDIVNKPNGVFYGVVEEGAKPIYLPTEKDFMKYKELAQENGLYLVGNYAICTKSITY